MVYTALTFTTTATVNGNTNIQNVDEQINTLMDDVGNYLKAESQEINV